MKVHAALPLLSKALIYVVLAAVLTFSAVSIVAVQAASGISLRSNTTANNGAGSTGLTIAKPAGVVAGDVMVAQVVVNSSTVIITAPSGWTLIRNTAASSAMVMASYYKAATSSEPSSYRWTFSATQLARGGISDYIRHCRGWRHALHHV